MEFFKLSFTRINEHDPQELDIFSLQIQASLAPRCLADFSGGTAQMSSGYSTDTVSFDVNVQTERDDDHAILVMHHDPQYKLTLRLMDETTLKVGGKISIGKSAYERSIGKITLGSWL